MLLWEDGVARKLDIRVHPGEGEDGPSDGALPELPELPKLTAASSSEAEDR
jgi:hypothetical protein